MAEPGGTYLDSADAVWEKLAERLEAFAAAWHGAGEPPAIADYLPTEPAEIRRLVLTELIKLDFELRTERGLSVERVEQYGVAFPELLVGGVPVDLLYEEFHIRRMAGESVRPEEYVHRFPDQRDALLQLLQMESPPTTSALSATMVPTEFTSGDQVDDFDLLAQLGKGAFAVVFLARQRSLQRLVALKISSDRGTEPQTLAQLDHPNIVRVYDQRVLPERRIRLLYMKYVPGGTLEQAIALSRGNEGRDLTGRSLLEAVDQALDRRGESCPAESVPRARLETADWVEVVCRIGFQLAQALHYAHARGVLHRDLKPANILLTADAVPQLVDFNISFCSQLDGATPAAYFGGSLSYMSPEQLEACDPTHPRQPDTLTCRSDIYSLGVVLWEMFYGSRPFADERLTGSWSETLAEMVARRRRGLDRERLQPLAGPERDFSHILDRCLQGDTAQRYEDANDLANDLRLCLQPEARYLLRPDPGGHVTRMRRFTVLALALAALGPNVPTALFNYIYNNGQIIQRFPEAYPLFMKIQTIINAIAFPLGVALVASYIWPVWRGVRHTGSRESRDSDTMAGLRHRTLRIGHFIGLLAMLEWTCAGMAYPTAMCLGGVRLTLSEYLHFLCSLVLCGLVAAAYPFFFATAFAMRVVYPTFVEPFHLRQSDVTDLGRLEKWTWIYLALGLLVPMLAVALMATLGGQRHRMMLAIISGSSIAGFVLLVGLARYLQNLLTVLRQVSGVADKRAS